MCIYLTKETGLTYTSGEHIFPAGIGGKKKLPKTFVSDQFNNLISNVERAFMQDSLVSLPRQFEGPGKRGRLGEAHASTSRVHVITDPTDPSSFSLGYMKLAKQYLISHLTLDRASGHFTLSFERTDPANAELQRADFVEKFKQFDPRALKILVTDNLPKNLIMVGFQVKRKKEVKYFLAKHSLSDFELKAEQIEDLIKIVDGLPPKPETQSYIPFSNQDMIVRPNDDYRVPAKIAFNALADLIGYEKVRRACFDEIREWIVNGGEVKTVKFLRTSPMGDALTLPESAHMIIFQTNSERELFAIVILYDSIYFIVRLGIIDEDILLPTELPGMICNWRKAEEYTIEGWLLKKGK